MPTKMEKDVVPGELPNTRMKSHLTARPVCTTISLHALVEYARQVYILLATNM